MANMRPSALSRRSAVTTLPDQEAAMKRWNVGLAALMVACGNGSTETPDAASDAANDAVIDVVADAAPGALTVQTYTSSASGPIDIQVSSHLVLGPAHAILVDGQLLVADAQAVVSMVKASGRALDAVVLTHAHPDHYAGFAVIQAAFPSAMFVTSAAVLTDFQMNAPGTLQSLDSALGSLVATSLVTPTAIAGTTLTLDGQTLDVIELPSPGESADAVALGLPNGVLISGDLLYNDVHLYLGECHSSGWSSNLTAVQAMGYSTFYPGHGAAPVSASVFGAVASYIAGAVPILRTAEAADAGTSDAGDPRVSLAVGQIEAAFPAYKSQYLVGFSASEFIDVNKCP
jgi:glyoxylase-like metal-dependent hydrolase (beta-lactamase superfamily II)